MIPRRFEYEVAESVEHAVELLGAFEDAKVLAGGHSLLPLLKLRLAQPAVLVDIGRLSELNYIRDAGSRLVIGALTPHYRLAADPIVRLHCPLLSVTAEQVGDPQVRHRGTVGGSVAHGDPASDLPTVLRALDAEFVVRGPTGERTVESANFFLSFLETALLREEVLTEIRVPKLGDGFGSAYLKFRRRAQDWAIVGVAAFVRLDKGRVADSAVALTNMGDTPLRAGAVEQALLGEPVASIPAAALHATAQTRPPSDSNGSAEYRRHLACVLVRRALEQAVASCGASSAG